MPGHDGHARDGHGHERGEPGHGPLLPRGHPDLYHAAGVSFVAGAAIRRGPYTDCGVVGRSRARDGIDVHCVIVNGNMKVWYYVRNTSTGAKGWVRPADLRGEYGVP